MDPRPNLVPLKSRLLATPSNFALSRAEEMRAIDEYRERLMRMALGGKSLSSALEKI